MCDCCHSTPQTCESSRAGAGPSRDERAATPCAWFGHMIQNCLEYATEAKSHGRPIVCIMCEYTPRELIMAAGGVPVCLCGGTAETIPAAERELPANLCPLIKSTFGYDVGRGNPFLEMADLVVGETTCDGKKKMFELMGRRRPMHVLELPQKSNDADSFARWRVELDRFKHRLEEQFHVEITPDRLREAICVMNRDRALRRELAGLMRADRPPLTGRQLLNLRSSIAGIPDDLAQYEAALDMLRRRAASGEGVDGVRVLLTGVPVVHGAERVVDLIEDAGGLIVASENCSGLKPVVDDVDPTDDDPMRALAKKYYRLPCSVMTPNTDRLDLLRELAEAYRPECVVELVWQACLTYDVESNHVKRMVEEELHLPYLHIETDYSPSDSARIGVRIEALFETVRA
ncbi:MAG TPA: double-cubane-cluster-containing anaerobic reductase [Thermoguttaceae bacterium]|nr:double-cubane-cluster-containing anaerobic reductase [Thermoguttaceae bacterium]